MDEHLRRDWHDLLTPLDVDTQTATAMLRRLWRRYGEAHRAYHTLAHIRHVLDVIGFLLEQGEDCDDPAAVRLAAWYHDAVYEPGRPDNEAASAALATGELLAAGIARPRIDQVAALVRATAAHRARTPDEAVLIDADLAILAADPDTYEVYTRAVRVEYGHLSDAQWRAGRRAVLEGFLARVAIFTTATMRSRGEAAARANLRAELTSLAGD